MFDNLPGGCTDKMIDEAVDWPELELDNLSKCRLCNCREGNIISNARGYRVQCSCGVTGMYDETPEGAMNKWEVMHG